MEGIVPVLPISDGDGNFLPTALSCLSAVMKNPQGGDAVESAVRSAVSRALGSALSLRPPQEMVLISAGELAALMDPTIRGSAPDDTLPEAGILALYVLTVNVMCAEHRPGFVSVQRAASTLSEKSRTTVLRAWKAFGRVSHLWAAIPYKPFSPDLPDWRAHLREFLAHAEWLRKRSESVYAHGQRVPLLDPVQTWKCPPDIELPAVEPEILQLEG